MSGSPRQSILSPEITRRLIDRYVARDGSRAEASRSLIATLTGHEREVLVMIGTGLSNADTGVALNAAVARHPSYGRLGSEGRCTHRRVPLDQESEISRQIRHSRGPPATAEGGV